MEFHASFIIGAPGDTEEDLMEIEKLLSEIKPTLVTFNQLKLFPGTDIYNSPEKYNILPFDPYWFEKMIGYTILFLVLKSYHHHR